MTCRKAALAATAAVVAVGLATAGGPAQARGLFGSKPPPAAKPAVAAPPAKPVRATAAERDEADRLDPLARAAFWAKATLIDPTDADAQLRLSTALRVLGRFDEAAAAAERALAILPGSEDAMLEVARARIAGGQGFYAVDVLNRAAVATPRDWRPHSLLGVAMEQVKRIDDARGEYARALQLSPDNPAVLSNLALLNAGAGDRVTAEALLRRAAAQPSATVQERANLALVLGLSGRVGEAEQIIRRDLPPELAEQNLAYLRAASASR